MACVKVFGLRISSKKSCKGQESNDPDRNFMNMVISDAKTKYERGQITYDEMNTIIADVQSKFQSIGKRMLQATTTAVSAVVAGPVAAKGLVGQQFIKGATAGLVQQPAADPGTGYTTYEVAPPPEENVPDKKVVAGVSIVAGIIIVLIVLGTMFKR